MKRLGMLIRLTLLPLIVVAFTACADSATAPKMTVSGPALDVLPATYGATFNGTYAPSGTHLQAGTPGCTVNTDRSIDCSAFQLAGVGNTNILVLLFARYTATIDCNNPSANNKNNPVESHTSDFTQSSSLFVPSTKNGRLSVPSRQVSPFTAPQVCPNTSWVPEIQGGSVELLGFWYAIVFAGFDDNLNQDFILIAQGLDPR